MSEIYNNGLRRRARHRLEASGGWLAERAAAAERASADRPARDRESAARSEGEAPGAPLDPAGTHDGKKDEPLRLARQLAQDALLEHLADDPNAAASESTTVTLVSRERCPPLRTTLFKFGQRVAGVPVFGSQVVVELHDDGTPVSVDAAMASPSAELAIPSFPPDRLAGIVDALVPEHRGMGSPALEFWCEPSSGEWSLVYKVACLGARPSGALADWMAGGDFELRIDAHSGALLSSYPLEIAVRVEEDATDAEGQLRRIACEQNAAGVLTLSDSEFNVQTHDFGGRDIDVDAQALPGQLPTRSVGASWSRNAVSAHANTIRVARFLKTVLGRNGLNRRGGAIQSTIDCIDAPDAVGRVWVNAKWLLLRQQVVYGQYARGGDLVSLAAHFDIVAHELVHGLVFYTAAFGPTKMPGALNESYADIFACLMKNEGNADPDTWDFDLGVSATPEDGQPARNLANPAAYQQAAHMSEYQDLPETSDAGGVHTNSGIHNLAAARLLTARASDGRALYSSSSGALLFFGALWYLGPTSTFLQSRDLLRSATLSQYGADPLLNERLSAVASAFDFVGISPP